MKNLVSVPFTDTQAVTLDYPLIDMLEVIPYPIGIFGGAPRSWCFFKEPRDIDVAVDCTEAQLEELLRVLDAHGFIAGGRTRFGGHKYSHVSGLQFDFWPLQNTWALKNAQVPKTFSNLADYASWNADCIVIECEKGRITHLHDGGFFKLLRTKSLEINYWPNPAGEHNALRGLRIAAKYNLSLGDSAVRYIEGNLYGKNPESLRQNFEKYYAESADDVLKLYNTCVLQ